jgi:hypothetical protein
VTEATFDLLTGRRDRVTTGSIPRSMINSTILR